MTKCINKDHDKNLTLLEKISKKIYKFQKSVQYQVEKSKMKCSQISEDINICSIYIGKKSILVSKNITFSEKTSFTHCLLPRILGAMRSDPLTLQ